MIKVIMEDMRLSFRHYLEFEENQTEAISYMLDRGMLAIPPDSYVEFLAIPKDRIDKRSAR
jgi:hypothetical protein